MARIKAYTDLEQSKKLAEFLPLESADMRYTPFGDTHPWVWDGEVKLLEKDSVPCWSLGTLLDVLPKICYPVKDHPTYLTLGKPKDKWCALYWDTTGMQDGEQTLADNPVDACYEMILKLHELNLL